MSVVIIIELRLHTQITHLFHMSEAFSSKVDRLSNFVARKLLLRERHLCFYKYLSYIHYLTMVINTKGLYCIILNSRIRTNPFYFGNYSCCGR